RESTQSGTNGSYTVTDRSVQVRGFQVSYTGVESVDLTTGQAGAYVSIPSTAADVPGTVHTGKGDANIVLGTFGAFFTATADMSNIRSMVTVDASGGSVLSVGDVNLGTGQTYVITDTAVRRSDGPEVRYRGLKTLTVTGTRAGDVFDVESTAAGVKTALNGGFGNNVYDFGSATHQLDGIQGAVSIQGSIFGKDAEMLSFFDDQAT